MVPVYTHSLSTSDYGLLDTILRFVAMCMSVAFLGMRQAYQRLYFDVQTEANSRTLTSTVVLANFAVAVMVLFPLLTLASLAGRDLGAGQLTLTRSAALALWIAFEATYMVGLTHLQVRMRSSRFVIAQSSRLLLLICLNVILLRVFHLGLNGALLGNVAASGLSGLFTAAVLLRSTGFHLSRKYFKGIVTFGVPYIPTVVFFYVIGNADRLALIHFGAMASLGLLALAAKIGELALMVFAGPVDNVWAPYAFSVYTEVQGRRKIGALYTKFVAMYVFMALGASLAAPIGVALLAKPDYAFAARLVPLVAIGWIFNVLTTLSDIGILISKKTWFKPLTTGVVSLVAVTLQSLLTPRFGVTGAAAATALTYLTLFILVRSVSQRLYPIVTQPRDFWIIALGAALALLVGAQIMHLYSSLWVSFIVTIAGVSGYAALLLRTRVIDMADVRSIASKLGIRLDFFERTTGTRSGGAALQAASVRTISTPFWSSEGTRPKLRVALLTDGEGVPRYARAVIEDLLRADFTQLVAWLRVRSTRPLRETERSDGLALRLFKRFIESRYPAAPDPLEMVECTELRAAATIESIEIALDKSIDRDVLEARLRELRPDVVVDLSSSAPRGAFCAVPTHGFWRFHFGESKKYPDGSAFLREIIDGEPLTVVELKNIAADRSCDEVLCRAEFSTQPYPSRAFNRLGPLWSAQHFVIEELWKLHMTGATTKRDRAHSTGAGVGGKAGSVPSGTSIALWLLRKYARRLRLARKTSNEALTWRLAIRRSSVPLHVDSSKEALREFRWLPTTRGHSWADPMLFRHDSSTWLFFEHWQNGVTQGEIWRGLVGPDGSLSEVRPCLRRAHHLSYPQLVEEGGDIFLIPESEEAGGVDLYRARHFPDDWVLEERLIDLPCVDPSVFESQGRWWMIVSPQNVKGVAAISWLFTAPRLRGPWRLHAANPIATSADNARGAGAVFAREGTLIRPSQDCGLSYGKALLFNEIICLEAGRYAEKAIARVDPGWKPGLAGVHAYSRAGDWEVIDGGFTSDGEDSLFDPPDSHSDGAI